MKDTIGSAPPVDLDADEGDENIEFEVGFEGHAALEATRGANMTGLTRGDFVIDSAIAGAAMAQWERLGYRIYARDPQGREFALSPAVLAIRPPGILSR